MTEANHATNLCTPGRFLAQLFLSVLFLAPIASAGQERSEAPAVDQLLAAIVGVRARVPEHARTADALGIQRAGSGVVIDGNGLIVTIGYLILEARHVEVMVTEDRIVEAEILAYDHETGFGLLRASEPIDVAPMRLGESASLEQGDQLLVSGFGGRLAARPVVLVSRRDFAGYWEYLLENAIFTAPPYPLFGGAALINSQGELVGIGSLVVADAYRGEQPLPGNMFLPVNRLKEVLGDLLTAGRSMADFYRKLWAAGEPGDKVPLTILKGAQMHEVNVTAGDRYQWLHLQ